MCFGAVVASSPSNLGELTWSRSVTSKGYNLFCQQSFCKISEQLTLSLGVLCISL